jgi:hypothetical protein
MKISHDVNRFVVNLNGPTGDFDEAKGPSLIDIDEFGVFRRSLFCRSSRTSRAMASMRNRKCGWTFAVVIVIDYR